MTILDQTGRECFSRGCKKHSSDDSKSSDGRKVLELEREIMSLKIANRGKDYLIDQLKGERTGFFEKLLSANRFVGELEIKLPQLDEPNEV